MQTITDGSWPIELASEGKSSPQHRTMESSPSISGSRLPKRLRDVLRLPLIAAPMLRISGPDLVVAACRAGIVGAFPTLNPKLVPAQGGLHDWLCDIRRGLEADPGAFALVCPNLIMKSEELDEQVETILRHGVEMVITSVGSPKPVMARLKEAGVLVFADVATIAHARKAIDAGVDGLVLLAAGAGGQTGWLNPFAYVRAVRGMFDGPVVIAGGISDGVAVRAAEILGCDLSYMGTKFIAASESLATDEYRNLLVESSMDDIVITKAFNGLWGSYLRATIVAAGLDPDSLDESISAAEAKARYGPGSSAPQRWTGLKSAGHSVSGVRKVETVAAIVERTLHEYLGEHSRTGTRGA
jgi:nitronate monooxygenase